MPADVVVQPEGALALLDARTLDWSVVGDKDMNPLFILRLEALVEAADERRHPQQQGVPVVPWILEEAVRGVAVCTAANGRAALEELPDVPAAGEHGNEHGGEQVGWGGPGALGEAAAPEHGAHPYAGEKRWKGEAGSGEVGIKGVIGYHGVVRSFDAIVLLLKTILSKDAYFFCKSISCFSLKRLCKNTQFCRKPRLGAHPLPPSPCQDRILRSRKGAQALPYSHFKPKTEMQK